MIKHRNPEAWHHTYETLNKCYVIPNLKLFQSLKHSLTRNLKKFNTAITKQVEESFKIG